MVGSDKTYDAVVTETTDTELKCYLRGGMPGDYQIYIVREGYGKSSSTVNTFSYETLIQSVTKDDDSAAVGSEAGGTRIKITGTNFIPSETIIFIGDRVNWICQLDEGASSATELYCTTPPRHESYTTPQ